MSQDQSRIEREVLKGVMCGARERKVIINGKGIKDIRNDI